MIGSVLKLRDSSTRSSCYDGFAQTEIITYYKIRNPDRTEKTKKLRSEVGNLEGSKMLLGDLDLEYEVGK